MKSPEEPARERGVHQSGPVDFDRAKTQRALKNMLRWMKLPTTTCR